MSRGLALLWSLLWLAPGPCWGLEVVGASLREGRLEVRLGDVLDEGARRSVVAGVPLRLLYEVRVLRPRPWPLPDRCLFAWRVLRTVSYDVLTREFRVEAEGGRVVCARWEEVTSLLERLCLGLPSPPRGRWRLGVRVRLRTVEPPLWLRPLGWARALWGGGWRAVSIPMPRN